MPIKNTFEASQPNKSEQVSAKMYNMADKVDGAKQPKLHETFDKAGAEFAQGNYDKGQRLLETNGAWNDEVRGVASEANQADQERVGASSLGFGEAKTTINGYAKNLESLGTQSDKQGAMEIQSLLRGMDRPGQAGIDGINESLKYIEGLLQTKAFSERQMSPAMKKSLEEQRAMRDALFAEKQKRTEQLQQGQQVGEQLLKDRKSASRVLENLYSNAEVPDDMSSRQELGRRVERMSQEELRFLDADLRKATADFGRTRDAKTLDAALRDLSLKKFTKEALKTENKTKDKQELDRVRAQINGGEKPAQNVGTPKPPERKQSQAVEVSSPKEIPKQEKAKSQFADLFSSPEITNALNSNEVAYTDRKGVAAVVEVFKKLYPNAEQSTARAEVLLKIFHTAVEEGKKQRPDIDEFGSRSYATKKVMNSLSEPEARALLEFKNANSKKLGFGDYVETRHGSFELEFRSFIDKLEELEKSKASSKTRAM